MARMPNEEIEPLKKEIPMERLVTGFAVESICHERGISARNHGAFRDELTETGPRRLPMAY